ncbi:MAG TPA: 2-C-methyl-D-erythritol 4-phosphate cytidylyltransferase [Acidimicrobiia bacterium]
MTVWGIVVAGGQGSRFGAPKQFRPLGATGHSLVDHSVATAGAVCDHVVVVLPEACHWQGPPVAAAVTGGERRSDSVRAGLAAVDAGADVVVVVHDAARPLASPALFRAVIDAVHAGADGAVPALALADTVKRVEDDRVIETVPREGLAMIQTPQAFRAGVLRRAHEGVADATDDAALVEAAGGVVVVVPGEPTNLKVTTAGDLEIVEALLESSRESSS